MAGRTCIHNPERWRHEPTQDSDRDRLGALTLLDASHGGLFAVEDALVTAAVAQAGGNVAQAARSLKITRAQIDHRLKRLAAR
jgi:transcriptional regulator with GAF, ATPase, and Fis domain